jgi:hypothetical protein
MSDSVNDQHRVGRGDGGIRYISVICIIIYMSHVLLLSPNITIDKVLNIIF